MLKIMARPRQAPCLLLGIGTYYVSAAHNTQLGTHKWQMLELRNPLILDGQQARVMFRRHHADSLDHKTASAGAWSLRDEVTSQGHDAIIAVEGIGDERHLTIAHFDAASAVRGTASVIDFPAQSRGKKIAGSDAALARAS
ncbi:MAG TPA: hypothetical protein VHX19_13240 [Stellaceae bacterium]|jgi:hypothetical protein|nr:hypothetical protein [Stellaceae bacterium]